MKQYYVLLLLSVSVLHAMKETPAAALPEVAIEVDKNPAQEAANTLLAGVKFFATKGYTTEEIGGALEQYAKTSGISVDTIVQMFSNKTAESKADRAGLVAKLLDLIVDNKDVQTAQAQTVADLATGNAQKSKIGMYILGILGVIGTIASTVATYYLAPGGASSCV